jgi:NADPH:quinone reductase-like Zn-dependent oxidoreductase
MQTSRKALRQWLPFSSGMNNGANVLGRHSEGAAAMRLENDDIIGSFSAIICNGARYPAMKAVVYTRYGPPEVLHVKEVEKPRPGEDEVLIRVHAAEATKADCELRSFHFPVKWFWLPLRLAMGITRPRRRILGGYFAGEIEVVGNRVTRLKPGDQVFGCAQLRLGSYGEHVCLPASYTIVPKPRNLTFEEAAAVPLGALNALHFLRRANVRNGERVLVNGAGGSIGTFAVQIARTMGAKVTAIDSANKECMLRRIGADRFIDYRKEDFTAGGETYDVIFDMVVANDYSACVASLAPGGRYLIGNPRLSDMARAILTNRFTDKTVVFALAGETEEELSAITAMIQAGEIRPVIDRVCSREQAAEAHRRVETEQRVGIVVISLEDPGGEQSKRGRTTVSD